MYCNSEMRERASNLGRGGVLWWRWSQVQDGSRIPREREKGERRAEVAQDQVVNAGGKKLQMGELGVLFVGLA